MHLRTEFEKVKGHSGDLGNEAADRLADAAVFSADPIPEIDRLFREPSKAHIRWKLRRPPRKEKPAAESDPLVQPHPDTTHTGRVAASKKRRERAAVQLCPSCGMILATTLCPLCGAI